MKDGEGINDSAGRIETSEFVKSSSFFDPREAGKRGFIKSLWAFSHCRDLFGQPFIESLCDLLGFADTTALNDDIVELSKLGQANKFLEEIST